MRRELRAAAGFRWLLRNSTLSRSRKFSVLMPAHSCPWSQDELDQPGKNAGCFADADPHGTDGN